MALTDMIPGIAQLKAGLRLLPYVGIFAAALWGAIEHGRAVHWHKSADACATARKADETAYRDAASRALADALAAKAATEARYTSLQKETDDALTLARSDGHDAALRYIRLHPASAADQRGPGKTDMSGAAPAPGAVDDAGRTTVVPASDVLICADNTAKAEGWRAWYSRLTDK